MHAMYHAAVVEPWEPSRGGEPSRFALGRGEVVCTYCAYMSSTVRVVLVLLGLTRRQCNVRYFVGTHLSDMLMLWVRIHTAAWHGWNAGGLCGEIPLLGCFVLSVWPRRLSSPFEGRADGLIAWRLIRRGVIVLGCLLVATGEALDNCGDWHTRYGTETKTRRRSTLQ